MCIDDVTGQLDCYTIRELLINLPIIVMKKLVIYSHGKDSTPWGEKTTAFAEIAKSYAVTVLFEPKQGKGWRGNPHSL